MKKMGQPVEVPAAADALRQLDVTAAAWRLALHAAWGKPVNRDAAIRTLIAAGADTDAALILADTAVGSADTRNQGKTPPLARAGQTCYTA